MISTKSLDFVSEVQHPRDLAYRMKFSSYVNDLLTECKTDDQVKAVIKHLQQQPGPKDPDGAMTRRIMGDLYGDKAPTVIKNILGPNSGTGLTDGSALVRQDLDAALYTLFVRKFPVYEILTKEPSNGLTHAYDVITAPDPNTTVTSNTISTVVTDLNAVGFTASTYSRQTSNIAVFGLGRGVTFKEQAAVRQGGMPWDPMNLELSNGAVKIAYDIQTMLVQGNSSYSSGTATNEGGAYNTAYFDGLRLITGSVAGSNYATNNATQIDQGGLSITWTLQTGLTKAAMMGGMPDMILLTYNALQKFQQEQQDQQRYPSMNATTVEVLPGVKATQVTWMNGTATLFPVPGFSWGSYLNPNNSTLCEDIYFLDSANISIPWLFSENLTTLELPGAVDFTLSQRYVLDEWDLAA